MLRQPADRAKVATILLALLSTTAHAQNVLPPAEYDRRYEGKLTVITQPQDVVRFACPNIKMAAALGCAKIKSSTECTIILAPTKDIEAAGYTVEAVMRHELGH